MFCREVQASRRALRSERREGLGGKRARSRAAVACGGEAGSRQKRGVRERERERERESE